MQIENQVEDWENLLLVSQDEELAWEKINKKNPQFHTKMKPKDFEERCDMNWCNFGEIDDEEGELICIDADKCLPYQYECPEHGGFKMGAWQCDQCPYKKVFEYEVYVKKELKEEDIYYWTVDGLNTRSKMDIWRKVVTDEIETTGGIWGFPNKDDMIKMIYDRLALLRIQKKFGLWYFVDDVTYMAMYKRPSRAQYKEMKDYLFSMLHVLTSLKIRSQEIYDARVCRNDLI